MSFARPPICWGVAAALGVIGLSTGSWAAAGFKIPTMYEAFSRVQLCSFLWIAKVKLQCQRGPFSWWGKVVQYLQAALEAGYAEIFVVDQAAGVLGGHFTHNSAQSLVLRCQKLAGSRCSRSAQRQPAEAHMPTF